MKIAKEEVVCDPGQSFRLFEPRLRNHFFWHYHPEIELVYVEASHGICHVGQHVSSFTQSALVLIGPNVPHLNFDYGVKTAYRQVVIQLKQDFLGTAWEHTPEFARIARLFERSVMGIAFSTSTAGDIVKRMREMKKFSGLDRLLRLVEILDFLAEAKDATLLNTRDTRVKLFLNDKIRMGSIYEYIHARYDRAPDVNEVAAKVHLSTAAFCRYFKQQTNLTFTDFVNQYRITQAKTLLLKGYSVSQTCYDVGFESLSYFNALFRRLAGENPSAFRKRLMQH